MLSISQIKSSSVAASYFQKDDYYAKDGDSPDAQGTWFGKGAESLGLDGAVDKDVFKAMLDGHLPNGVELGTVRERGGEKEHIPGWDLTFSAPKSVSILALSGGDERLMDAHEASVKDALGWLEKELAGHRKRGMFGVHHSESESITAALFTHVTSREKDMQLHTHAVVMNANEDESGKWRSINSEKFYEYKMALGGIYRAAFAARAQELGHEIERVATDGRWEIKAVDVEVREHFSQRREQIKDAMEKYGLEGPAAAEQMALMTRKAKTVAPIEQLQSEWAARNAELGFDPQKVVAESRQRGPVRLDDGRSVADGVGKAITRLSDKEAVFSEARLLQWSLAGSVGHGTIKDVEATVAATLADRSIRPTRNDGSKAFTTPAAIKIEKDVIETWKTTRDSVTAPVGSSRKASQALDQVAESIEKSGGNGFALNDGQTAGAVAILTQKDRFIGVIGRPGVGKTTMLGRVRPVLEDTGYKPIGLAGNANAARTIKEESGIDSRTLASHMIAVRKLATRFDRGNQVERASILAETSKQVWIIDEASQISGRDMRRTMKLATKLNARVVMLGDDKQLAAIEAGKPFAQLVNKGMSTTVITENMRQREATHRDAVKLATEGKVKEALAALQPETREVKKDDKRIAAIVKAWSKLDANGRETAAVLTARNAERTILNESIRDVLRQEGKLKGEVRVTALSKVSAERVDLTDILSYKKNDVLTFGKSNEKEGIDGRAVYKVVAIDKKTRSLTLEVRDGENAGARTTWDPARFAAISRMGVTQFRERETSLAPGEKIQWGRNMADKKFSDGQSLLNGNIYTVASATPDRVELRNKAGGRIELDPKQMSGQVWDHAWATTTYKSQGRTEETVLINAESNRTELFSEKAFLVAISRHKGAITLFTDDSARFSKAVAKYSGEKTTVEGANEEARFHTIRIAADNIEQQFKKAGRKFGDALGVGSGGRTTAPEAEKPAAERKQEKTGRTRDDGRGSDILDMSR